MMNELLKRWPLLMVSTVLLLGAAISAIREGFDGLALGLFSGGMVVLGAWLAMEVRNHDD
jgi:hypothetical protein